jgi:hypothetical protein
LKMKWAQLGPMGVGVRDRENILYGNALSLLVEGRHAK